MSIKSILIIEDDEGNRFLMKIMIQKHDANIEVTQAYDGGEALDLIRSLDKKPDIIFLDLSMPGMGGHEFLHKYAKTTENQDRSSIVIMSSSDQAKDKERALAYDFILDYLVKPIAQEDIDKIQESFTKRNEVI